MLKYTRRHRLLKSEDFRRVFSLGKKKHLNGITVLAYGNNQALPRLGFALSKKQIKKAVQRNKIKRIAKEAFRNQQTLLAGVDYVVLVNKTCLNHNKTDLYQYFQRVLGYAGELFDHSS
jgi:ribonuclease P protein component